MLQRLLLVLSLAAIVAVASSCRKAGKGGKAQLNIHVFNGNSNVPYAFVKIKFGAKDFPGAGASYDETVQLDYRGQISVNELRRGDYYIYSFTYDSASTQQPLPLWQGGTHFEITNRNGERSVVIDMANDPE